MASEHYKKKEKTAIEVQEECDLAIRRMRESQAKYNPVEFFSAERRPTNADLIRAMSDEELAKTMNSTGECPPCKCPYAYADLSESGGNMTDKQCVECWLDWLKSPVEVDHGDPDS